VDPGKKDLQARRRAQLTDREPFAFAVVIRQTSDNNCEDSAVARCDVCKNVIFGNGYKSDGQVFCSAVCSAYSPTGRFCDECESETLDEPAGRIYLHHFLFGSSLLGHRDRCPRCYSVVQRRWLHAILPIPRAQYRVLYLSGTVLNNKFLSRRVNGPLGEMFRQGPRPDRPRTGSPVPKDDGRRWWMSAIVGALVAGWGVYEYTELTRLEISGGHWSSLGIITAAYRVGGKRAVLGLIGAFAALFLVSAVSQYRKQCESTL
jgi:hypothetical protein